MWKLIFYQTFNNKTFPSRNLSKSRHRKVFSKIVLLQLWSKSLKNKKWKSSFFSIGAGHTLETSILILNSFTGIFFKVFKHKCRTAILQINFLERMYFGRYMGIAKHFWKTQLLDNACKGRKKHAFRKIFNFHSV